MLKHHLLVASRTLRRERGYAALNVVGLAVGLACCALIVLYVRDELSYDRHHERADRIVRVTRPTADGSHWAATGPPLGLALEEAMPEVERAARVFPIGSETVLSLSGTDRRFEAPDGVYADASVLDVFTLPLLRGDPATALDAPGSVVLSASMAERLFGTADPVGRTLDFRGPADLTVTGVFADLPATTHLPLAYAVSMETFYAQQEDASWLDEARGWAGFYTYLLLRRPGDAAAVTAKLPDFVDTFFAEDYDERPSTQTSFRLQPITDIHLHSKLEKEYRPNGDAIYVGVFALVALFVLVIAAVNFINLTTARSGSRLREVGVRKALGSTRGQLARQFLTESLLTSALAFGVAVSLVLLALPLLNGLTGKAFTAADALTPAALLGLLGLAVGTGAVAGLYPALFMASFRPTRALRNDPTGRQPALLRHGLVAFQFALSIFMLIGTAVVFSQLDYVRSQRLGFDEERVVEVRLDGYAAYEARQNLDTFKEEVMRSPAVAGVSLASNAPGRRYSLEFVRAEEQPEDEETLVRIAWGVDHDYARALGLTIAEGRDFSPRAPADTTAWLINESAARELGLDEPVGQVLRWGSQGYAGPVVGVVEDFHFASLHDAVEPLVIPLRPGVGGTLLVRVRDDAPAALAHVRAQIDALVPGSPFRYTVLDDTFDQLYRQEEQLSRVFGLFSGLAVLVACLGLFGLAAYTAERRRKEVGIRKVLGASVGHVVVLLSKDFARLVVVAFVVAAPVAYLVMSRWLDGFAYRVEMGPAVFLLAGTTALAIALATVSVHAVRAATADPVRSLRSE